jgi:hypothetical protein
MPAKYTATIEAQGYQPVELPLRSTLNPWILGNVFVGGLPGLVVDTATGAAWKPRRATIHQNLAPAYGPGTLPFMPVGEVPRDDSVSQAEYVTDEPLPTTE